MNNGAFVPPLSGRPNYASHFKIPFLLHRRSGRSELFGFLNRILRYLKVGICEIVMSSANLEDLNKVWEIKALKRKPREDEARKILEKVANQVQPIMTRRKWRVKLLSEFW